MRTWLQASALALLGWGVLVGCDSSAEEARLLGAPKPTLATPSPAPTAKPGPSAAPAPLAVEPKPAAPTTFAYRLPAAKRLVAFGDLHGDIVSTREVLRLAGALGADDHWAGKDLVVVQTGDQFDRGDGEREILELLERLQAEAQAAGGALHVLNGNHETMNVLGDFRYVTPKGLHAFDDATPPAPNASRYPSDQRGRAGAFLPGGPVALRLAPRPVILQVGDTVFAHAGVRAPHVDFGIDRLNAETSAWMRGEIPLVPRLIQDQEGPVWTRVYGSPELDAASCEVLTRALERLGARRMVVGHSVQPGGVTAGCDGKIQRIDVGLSSYYGSAPLQALEIVGDKTRVLTAPRASR